MHLSWGQPTPDHQTLVSFASSLLSSPLSSISSCPNSSPSKFPTPFFLPPPSHRSCCLSPPPLPPHALRLTTLFPFKIKIIKSATKWERLRCWRHHFDVLFQHYIININSSVPNYCCSRTVTHICTILASTQHIPLTPSHLLLLLFLLYTQRRIWHAKRYCLRF